MTTIPLFIASPTRADTEALSAALLRRRQGGSLSPNDCREETGWPRVEGGYDIAPPISRRQAGRWECQRPAAR